MGSPIDPGAVVSIGRENAHEGQPRFADHVTRVEQNNRYVSRVPGDMLEQSRGAEEWIERTGPSKEDDGLVEVFGVFVENAIDFRNDVLGEPLWALDQRHHALLERAQTAPGVGRLGQALLTFDHRIHELGSLRTETRKQ